MSSHRRDNEDNVLKDILGNGSDEDEVMHDLLAEESASLRRREEVKDGNASRASTHSQRNNPSDISPSTQRLRYETQVNAKRTRSPIQTPSQHREDAYQHTGSIPVTKRRGSRNPQAYDRHPKPAYPYYEDQLYARPPLPHHHQHQQYLERLFLLI